MVSLLSKVEDTLLRRAVEETAERAMREQAASGSMDENAIARRFYRLLYADDSPVVQLIRSIPGVRYAPHLALTLGAEYLRLKADGIFPGDNRPIIRGLRMVLRYAAPTLEGIGDATADVMEGQIDSAVNAAKGSTSSATSQKGVLDLCRVWLVDPPILLIPTVGSDGSVKPDSQGDPIPANFSPQELSRWLSDEYTKGSTKKVRNEGGKGSRDVPVPPKKRNLSGEIGFGACLALVGGPKGLSPEQADRIEKLGAPPKAKDSWESLISPDVDSVLSWLIDVLSLGALNLTALERQEIEDLVQKMNAQKPEPEWVNRRLGRFRVETDRFPLNGRRVYNAAQLAQIKTLFSRIRNEIDITLKGEQSLTTKARKGLQAAPDILRQVRALLSSSAPWVNRGLLWWRNAFIVAIVLLLLGILAPVAWIGEPWVTLTVFLCATAGGIIGFATTWPFPLVQKVYDQLQRLISDTSVDSINSLGRRIASFALCIGVGVLPLTIWFEFPVIVRAGIVAFGGLFPIGIMFALKEAGYPDVAQRMAKRSLLIANVVFGTLAVSVIALVGFVASYTGKFMTGPEFLRWSVDGSVNGAGHVSSWFAKFTAWHWLGFGALVVFGLFLVSLFFGKSKAGTDGADQAMTFAGIMLGGGVFLAVLFAIGWLGLAGLREIGSWFDDDPAPTVQNQVVQQAPVPKSKKPTNKELCDADKVDYATCKDWGYKD